MDSFILAVISTMSQKPAVFSVNVLVRIVTTLLNCPPQANQMYLGQTISRFGKLAMLRTYFCASCCLSDKFLRPLQSRVNFCRLCAASLSEIRSSAATTANHAGQFFDDVTGMVALGQLFRHGRDQVDVTVSRAGQNDDSGNKFLLELIGDIAQLFAVYAVDLGNQQIDTIDRLFLCQ